MTKSAAKGRNGNTRTPTTNTPSSTKVKGDESRETITAATNLATSNGKVKTRSGTATKKPTGIVRETAAVARKQKLNGHNGKAPNSNLQLPKMKQSQHMEKESIVLWKRPITTIHYFAIELLLNIRDYALKLWGYKISVFFSILLLVLGTVAYHTPGAHQVFLFSIEKHVLWCLYWLGLGVLSSVGLGTGLHTFLLYLGPHIAAVTLAAYECGTLDFPSPPYPDSIVCPDEKDLTRVPITVWAIMSKVRLEAMMWGAGTALGELPPYFMARAARLSTLDSKHKPNRMCSQDVEQLAEFEALQLKRKNHEQMTLLERLKLGVERLVERVGFLGILACASIPNPLFDLAGITCGHFLVPFWTFFGATLIGKAIIKTHLQQLTVIVAFNENLVSKLVTTLAKFPLVGSRLQEPLEQLLKSQKAKLHSKEATEGGSLLASLFEKLVMIMVIYFVVSIVNSLAQNYHQRIQSLKSKLPVDASRSGKSHRTKNETLAKQA